jgi:hypothetical protein
LTELRRPAALDTRRHERSQFDCGEAALDEWLRRYAGQNRRRDTAATWVIADANDRVAAHASIAMTGIDRSAAPAPLAKQAPDPVPALLLGRLAVDRHYSGRGTSMAGLGVRARPISTARRSTSTSVSFKARQGRSNPVYRAGGLATCAVSSISVQLG